MYLNNLCIRLIFNLALWSLSNKDDIIACGVSILPRHVNIKIFNIIPICLSWHWNLKLLPLDFGVSILPFHVNIWKKKKVSFNTLTPVCIANAPLIFVSTPRLFKISIIYCIRRLPHPILEMPIMNYELTLFYQMIQMLASSIRVCWLNGYHTSNPLVRHLTVYLHNLCDFVSMKME